MGLVFITGGSRGLGAALREEYHSRDWSVMEFARTGSGVHVDLTDTVDADHVFAKAFTDLSAHPVDEVVVINNAAMLGPVGPVAHAAQPDIQAHIDLNVVSGILLARAFAGAFQGHDCPKTFVNISSGAAVKGHAGWSLYCAGKAAMEGFVRAFALEQALEPHPISAINVNPGIMDTAMQAEIRAASVEDFPELERFIGFKLGGRLAQPETVAMCIVELIASRPSPGVTLGV